MIMPWTHHVIFRILIPMVNPISVLLIMIDRIKYHGVGPPDEASPQQTKPKISPNRVAMSNLFLLSIYPPCNVKITENFHLSSYLWPSTALLNIKTFIL